MFVIIYVIHHLYIINLINWNTSSTLLRYYRSRRVVRSVSRISLQLLLATTTATGL